MEATAGLEDLRQRAIDAIVTVERALVREERRIRRGEEKPQLFARRSADFVKITGGHLGSYLFRRVAIPSANGSRRMGGRAKV